MKALFKNLAVLSLIRIQRQRLAPVVFLCLFVNFKLVAALKFDINEFIADSLIVSLPVDSLHRHQKLQLKISDDRDLPGRIIGIRTSKKWHYIPVDQYILLQSDLAAVLQTYFQRDSVDFSGTLYIKNLHHWNDDKPLFNKGRKLNAYTVLEDSSGTLLGDWIWEYTLKPKKKQKTEIVIGALMDRWLTEQVTAIQSQNFHRNIYPYLFRRQLMNWWDFVILKDGFIVNAHLTLDFPADQQASWVRGASGIFYRKARYHQSIAIGGKDQHWYARMNKHFIRRLNITGRFGFNNFDSAKYDYLDFWNVFLVNFSVNAAIEYRPVYLKGLFFGIGLHGSVNLLPEVIDRFEPGLLLTTGIIIP